MSSVLMYADVAELTEWIGSPAPSNARALLRAASLLVRDATSAALYEVNTAGLPSDADTLAAFSDATCAHAEALDSAGVDPAAAGADSAIVGSSIGSASVSYTFADKARDARARLAIELCPMSLRILRDAGLLANPPMTFRG